MNEQDILASFLKDQKLKAFIFRNLRQSLSSIGFSDRLINELLARLDALGSKFFDTDEFGQRFAKELREIYSIGFFQNHVPRYFSEYVLPATPSVGKIIDVGCGTGILAHLYSQTGRFRQIIGVDIHKYPEWDMWANDRTHFKAVSEAGFLSFLTEEKPDAVVLTWTLHHMKTGEQERYAEYIFHSLSLGSKVVILEDSYSNELQPEMGRSIGQDFMSLPEQERLKIMSVYDWVANRVLAQRSKVPIPFGYRSLEGWEDLMHRTGFKTVHKQFIGFPDHRDINTPQSLLLMEKED